MRVPQRAPLRIGVDSFMEVKDISKGPKSTKVSSTRRSSAPTADAPTTSSFDTPSSKDSFSCISKPGVSLIDPLANESSVPSAFLVVLCSASSGMMDPIVSASS